MDIKKNFKLCYVDGAFAYFTTQELNKQWGDDWNDAPYQHNAGLPYTWHPTADADKEKWEIIKIAFYAPMNTPSSDNDYNSYSVDMINAGVIAWLATDRWSKKIVAIQAGASISEFISKIEEADGEVFLPKGFKYEND